MRKIKYGLGTDIEILDTNEYDKHVMSCMYLSSFQTWLGVRSFLHCFNTMVRITRIISVLSLANSTRVSRRINENVVLGLNARLKRFALCNVYISAEFKTIDLDWESNFVPVTLDVIHR